MIKIGNVAPLTGDIPKVGEDGDNGAGESTTLLTISRLIPGVAELGGRVTGGSITLEDKDLLQYSPHHVVTELGITLVPEGRRIFGNPLCA